jgi:glycosyltransferase involved in cell wall biosynthesis
MPNAGLIERPALTDPLVSVIISNYNYGDYLGGAIQSVLNQTLQNREIIVVDDGSTDNSRDVIDRFGQQVTPIFNKHRGHCAAVNTGFAASHGDFIIFLDADDYLIDDALDRLIEPLVDNPTVTKSQGYMIAVDGSDTPVGKRIPRNISPSGDYKRLSLKKGPQACQHAWSSGIAWTRWFLDAVFPLPEDADRRSDPDGCLSPVATLFGPIVSLAEPVGYYRIHERNMGPVGTVFTHASLVHQLLRIQHNDEFFIRWARHYGSTPETEGWQKWNRSWRTNLMAYAVSLMDSSRPPPFHELVLSPMMSGSTGPLKSIGLVVALTLIRISPRTLALELAHHLLGIPKPPGRDIADN